MMAAYSLIRPILMRMDPEQAHRLTIKILKTCPLPAASANIHPSLAVTLWNRNIPNPVGLAAGFDKNAEALHAAFRMGFGFVETGTVTPKPQAGNPKPRIFRDIDNEAVINRMGFPNLGLSVYKSNLQNFLEKRPRPPGLVGINVGMNKTQTDPARDYCFLMQHLGSMADYLTINISSPNTPGLRDLQSRDAFLDLTAKVLAERERSCAGHPVPVLVKLAPDLNETKQEELARAALDSGIDGLILTNTTLERPAVLNKTFSAEKGGLSGQPLKTKSTEMIRNFYQLTGGRIPIIGLGGIGSAEDAYEKIRAGANLVQLYTALIYKGPGVVKSINDGLARLLQKDGLERIADAVGLDAKA